MIEPGSGYAKGAVSATTVTTNLITVDNTELMYDLQPVEFIGCAAAGLVENVTYYVIGSTITTTQCHGATEHLLEPYSIRAACSSLNQLTCTPALTFTINTLCSQNGI
jgi:hypothetical protein